MLSQRAIDEVMAEFRSHFTPEQVEARNQRLRAQALEAQEREELYRKWGGPPLGLLIQREKEAKEAAARMKVEPLLPGPKGTIRETVPFSVLLGTIQFGAWRSPRELAKTYAKTAGWVSRVRSVAIAQSFLTAKEWRTSFVHHQWK